MKVEMTARNWILAIVALVDDTYPMAYKNAAYIHDFIFDGIDRINIADSYATGNNTTAGMDIYITTLEMVQDGENPYYMEDIVTNWFDRYETIAAIHFSPKKNADISELSE